jgi:adenosylmethionine-8-amino-7-oxononanoate aminotransferase
VDSGTSDHPALEAWRRNVARLAPEIMRDAVADALRKLARAAFDEYEGEIVRLRAQRDNAYAAERQHTAELTAEIARLKAELAEALHVTVLNVRKDGMLAAMEVSKDEQPGTIMQATDEPGLAFALTEDRTWRRLP